MIHAEAEGMVIFRSRGLLRKLLPRLRTKIGRTTSCRFFVRLVGVPGFEPGASWSRTKHATICATPRNDHLKIIHRNRTKSKENQVIFLVFFLGTRAIRLVGAVLPDWLAGTRSGQNAVLVHQMSRFFLYAYMSGLFLCGNCSKLRL